MKLNFSKELNEQILRLMETLNKFENKDLSIEKSSRALLDRIDEKIKSGFVPSIPELTSWTSSLRVALKNYTPEKGGE